MWILIIFTQSCWHRVRVCLYVLMTRLAGEWCVRLKWQKLSVEVCSTSDLFVFPSCVSVSSSRAKGWIQEDFLPIAAENTRDNTRVCVCVCVTSSIITRRCCHGRGVCVHRSHICNWPQLKCCVMRPECVCVRKLISLLANYLWMSVAFIALTCGTFLTWMADRILCIALQFASFIRTELDFFKRSSLRVFSPEASLLAPLS